MSEHENPSKGSTITIKTQTMWMIASFVFAILFIVSVATGGFSGNPSATGGSVNDLEPDENQRVIESVRVQIEENDPVLGNPDAEISIVEFSDFQCPFCERAHTGALAEFKQSSYFRNGQVNLVYKQFPLTSIHPQAQKSAEASLCAQDQGKFWEYHDMLFANQGALDVGSLKQYATQLGLNTAQFNSCLDGGQKRGEVSKESGQATTAGGGGTPYFVIINNENKETQSISGALPWTSFEAAINSLM